MSAAAISAQLVDVRNIGTHKCIKLTLHVPAEQAALVMEAFGWPTMTDPIPVALARLNQEVPAQAPPSKPDHDIPLAGERKPLTLASRAALLCKDRLFQRYIEVTDGKPCTNEMTAAHRLRHQCGVRSRAEIKEGTQAAETFKEIYDEFALWRDAPALVEESVMNIDSDVAD